MRRRERRVKTKNYHFLYMAGLVAILLAIMVVILYSVYNKKLNDISESMLSTEQIIGLVPNNEEDTSNIVETTGSIISKTIEDTKEQLEKIEEDNIENKDNIQEMNVNDEQHTQIVEEPKKELSFAYPVEGEVLRDYAMDELIYSETLDEWTVHQGIDIKAERATIVKASEEGTVVAIKNDPRYGLTVIIEHEGGYKTVYSNLLTTEFVNEDEKVEKGQSIGTAGNSAVFEIADEPHLHFEIIKDGENVDPKIYLK